MNGGINKNRKFTNLFIDHAALERDLELDQKIEQQREENRRHLRLKIRIADKYRQARETHKQHSTCERLSHNLSLLDKTPIYSNGRELYTLTPQFEKRLFIL
uniref:Uncharacterized protein n=1 Tax=Pectobacterium carotovorum TaxID=554 RepID=A0A0K0MNQ3_PECCA|nr:hypothetical protein [Pectobacterium carotovorum]AKG47450.1 hypothetical protein pA_00010 [Pectobacterium carotovorum]